MANSVTLRLYSSVFKANLKHRFSDASHPSRSGSKPVVPDAAFTDGVATKDLAIDWRSGLSVRIFLPDYAAETQNVHGYSWMAREMGFKIEGRVESGEEGKEPNGYNGYMPKQGENHHKLPVMVQFHSGGFVVGMKDSISNDKFCRRISKMCNAIVIAVGFRLAPENRCPAAIDDGFQVLQWLSRQAALACNQTSLGAVFKGKEREHVVELRETARSLGGEEIADPWLEAHADFSRTVLIGASSGGNIADQVTRRACTPEGSMELNLLSVAGQILLYPLFSGKIPTYSEVTMGQSSLFFDKQTLELVWRLFLKEDEFSLDSVYVNPLNKEGCPAGMPPTLFVTAELDMVRDRCIAYAELLRKNGVDSQVNNYKNAVHGFASSEVSLDSPQSLGCVEDISVWMHKRFSSKTGATRR